MWSKIIEDIKITNPAKSGEIKSQPKKYDKLIKLYFKPKYKVAKYITMLKTKNVLLILFPCSLSKSQSFFFN